jgi:putative PIN family toxin of toxin-antitoxin system
VKSPLAVIDTNVVVSGMLTNERDAPTRRILDAMLAGTITYLLSVSLLAEYRIVLLRPAIQERHKLTEHQIDIILEALAANGVVREPEIEGVDCPDPADAHVWALLTEDPRAVLVTGDRAPLESPAPGASVVTPAAFVAGISRFEGSSSLLPPRS